MNTIGLHPGEGFDHRYHASDGTANGLQRVGHNTYVIQAINLYTQESNDDQYVQLAEDLAFFVLSQQDIDGGILAVLL